MSQVEVFCFSCGAKTVSERIGFRQECDCGEDLHVCLNCKFYDASSYNECRETSADRVQEKDRSNLCEFFQAGLAAGLSLDKEREDLISAAEALFKK